MLVDDENEGNRYDVRASGHSIWAATREEGRKVRKRQRLDVLLDGCSVGRTDSRRSK